MALKPEDAHLIPVEAILTVDVFFTAAAGAVGFTVTVSFTGVIFFIVVVAAVEVEVAAGAETCLTKTSPIAFGTEASAAGVLAAPGVIYKAATIAAAIIAMAIKIYFFI